MSSFLGKYRFHLVIVFVGLCCLLWFNFLLQLNQQNHIYPDSYTYLESAQNLYLKFELHYYRPVLMALLNGIPYLFGSSDTGVLQWSLFLNVFSWLGTSLIVFEIVRNFVSDKIAFWFSTLPFFIVGNAVLNFHLLTESIIVFTVALAFYFLFRYYQNGKFLHLSIALSILLLSMLIKPGMKFFAVILVLYFIKVIFRNYKSNSMLFLYVSLVLITIQVVGMRVQYGNFTISYIDGVTYHNYICSKAECFKSGKEYDQIQNPRAGFLFDLDYPQQKKIATEDLKRQIRTNFANLVKAYFSDVAENSKSGNGFVQDLKNANNNSGFDAIKTFFFNLSKWQNRIFTLIGILISIILLVKTYKKPNPLIIISGFVLYVVVLSGVSCGQGDRFHLVFFPFTIVLLAAVLSKTRLFSAPLQK